MILDGAGKAFDGGWNKVKLYFMLGLPTETEDDMKDIAHLADKIARRYYEIPKDQRNGKCQITVSTSFFVPKPFTPFQWVPMNNRDEFLGKAKIVNQEVKDQLNRKSIKYNWHEADVTVLEGILARGDRRLAPAILRAYEKGALYDAWGENFKYSRWSEAFDEFHLDPAFYTERERSYEEILPWDFIRIGVTKKFLWKEWERAQKEEVTKTVVPAVPDAEQVYLEEVYVMKVRIKFRKQGVMKFIGHLDVMRYFQKAIRRADIDIAYTEAIQPAYDLILCSTARCRTDQQR